MQLGRFELTTISGGSYHIDAGTMFGVVPRTLWSRRIAVDDKHQLEQATNCVLVRTGERTALIDTGYGSKMSEKERSIFRLEDGDPLVASLADHGVAVEDIDTVILSHLHFDHAGGATRRSEGGEVVPTFPNAEYVVQRGEWFTAIADYPELRSAYALDNLLPLEAAGQLRFVDGDAEILPGIRGIVTGGHTQSHQALVIESENETAVFLADLCPSLHHLPTLWCMSYDVDLLQTRRMKSRLLGQIADGGWLALFDHDPEHAAARLCRDDKRDFAVTESIVSLSTPE